MENFIDLTGVDWDESITIPDTPPAQSKGKLSIYLSFIHSFIHSVSQSVNQLMCVKVRQVRQKSVSLVGNKYLQYGFLWFAE
jgi:hypothetical protein